MGGEDTFADVLAANAEYVRGFALAGMGANAARGLAVLTCMDSRIEPLAMLGLGPGDAKILRNAGARVTDDVLATLVIAQHLLGVDRLMVIPHTKCRMTAVDATELQQAIRDAGGPDVSDLAIATVADQEAALREDVDRVRSFERLAGLRAGGFLYDVDTGALSQVC